MGKIITNSDGSRTRISSSGRKFHYPKYGNGGDTKPYKQPSAEASKSFMDDWLGVTTTKDIKPTVTQAKADIPQKDINKEPLYIKPWNWNKPATGKIEESASPIDLIGTGIVSGVAKLGTKALQNTYKINPWAFKPNPKAYYRAIGEEGYKDAMLSKVIRANQAPNPNIAGNFNLTKSFEVPYFAPADKFKALKDYNPSHIIEVTDVPMRQRGFNWGFKPYEETGQKFMGKPVIQNKEAIPIGDNTKFYKQDWLQGYKEIPKVMNKKQPYKNAGKIKKPRC